MSPFHDRLFLEEMVNVCNEKMGKPFEKCNSAFDNVYRKCRKKMKIMKFVCKVVRVLQKLCHVVRVGELLCQMTSYVKNQAMKKIQNSEYRSSSLLKHPILIDRKSVV